MTKVPNQTITVDEKGVRLGEPMTLLDLKRLLRLYERAGNVPNATPEQHAGAAAALDRFLTELDINAPAWKPPAHAMLAFLNLMDKAPEDQRSALVQVVIEMLTSMPDIILAYQELSLKDATLTWRGPGELPRTQGDGAVRVTIPGDTRFSQQGEWLGAW